MDDEKPNPPSSSPSLSPPPLDMSLVRAFGALEAALSDLTTSSQSSSREVQTLARKVSDLLSQSKNRWKVDDEHREAILTALVKLTDSFDRLAQQENIAVGATVDARNALLAARDQIDARLKRVEEATGEHPLLPNDPDGMPRPLQIILLRLSNFGWKIGWKNKAKIVGWVMIAGTSIWHAIVDAGPYVKEWFR